MKAALTLMLRGDIYSVSGFYHITNGNHHVINTQLKRDVVSLNQVLLECHQGVIHGLKSAL